MQAKGHEELIFSDERREAVFKAIGREKAGAFNKEDFKALFRQACVVKKEVVATDGQSVTASKMLCKVKLGDLLETYGVEVEDEESKMIRMQCKLMKDDLVGDLISEPGGGFEPSESDDADESDEDETEDGGTEARFEQNAADSQML